MSILWWTELLGLLFDTNRTFCATLDISLHSPRWALRNVKRSNLSLLKQQPLPLCSSDRHSSANDIAVCSGAPDTTARTASSFGLSLFSDLKSTGKPNALVQLCRGDRNASAALSTDTPNSKDLAFEERCSIRYRVFSCSNQWWLCIYHSVDDATVANVGNQVLTRCCQWSSSLGSLLKVTNLHWSHVTTFALSLLLLSS